MTRNRHDRSWAKVNHTNSTFVVHENGKWRRPFELHDWRSTPQVHTAYVQGRKPERCSIIWVGAPAPWSLMTPLGLEVEAVRSMTPQGRCTQPHQSFGLEPASYRLETPQGQLQHGQPVLRLVPLAVCRVRCPTSLSDKRRPRPKPWKTPCPAPVLRRDTEERHVRGTNDHGHLPRPEGPAEKFNETMSTAWFQPARKTSAPF